MPNDWMPGVRQVETAATSPRTLEPDSVVCHVIQGWRTTMDTWAAERPVVNQASYHFVIDTDGTPTQYVPISKRAWHAGRVPDQKAAAAAWKLYRPGVNPNDHSIGIGAEGLSETSWNEAQHDSALEILRWLSDEWDIPINDKTVIGHRSLDPGSRAHDPGPNWDLEWLLEHVVPPGEENDQSEPPTLGPFDSVRWAEAWSRGAKPVRADGDDYVYEIRIRSTK